MSDFNVTQATWWKNDQTNGLVNSRPTLATHISSTSSSFIDLIFNNQPNTKVMHMHLCTHIVTIKLPSRKALNIISPNIRKPNLELQKN